MSLDATPADRELVYGLFEMIEGLPADLQVKLFHDLHNQVHTTANHYRVVQRIGYEEALRQATRKHLPNPGQVNLNLLQVHSRDIFDESVTALRRFPGQFWRRLMRRPAPKLYAHPSFTPENAIENNPDLLACLRARYGEATVARLRWPSYFCRPDEYLGCVETKDRLVFAVALEVWETGGPLSQQRLRQLGKLLNELEYERVVSYYEVDLADLHVDCVGSHKIYWNSHEGVIFPTLSSFASPPDQEALTEQLQVLCGKWLVSRGVQHTVQLTVDNLDYESSLRALLPADLWWTFGIAPPPDQVRVEAQDAFLTVAGRAFELPHFTVRQLSWLLFSLFVVLLVGGITFIDLVTPEAVAPVDARDLPPGPPLLLENTPPEPFTWLAGLKITGFLVTALSPFIAFGAACYLAMYMLAHVLCVNTPLGTPKEKRYTIYVSGDS